MFGVNMTEKDENFSEEEFMNDFGIEDEDDMYDGDIVCINNGGCCDGDYIVGVMIDEDSTDDINLSSFSMSDLLRYEQEFYDILEEHDMLKKYGKGKFIIFNYIW